MLVRLCGCYRSPQAASHCSQRVLQHLDASRQLANEARVGDPLESTLSKEWSVMENQVGPSQPDAADRRQQNRGEVYLPVCIISGCPADGVCHEGRCVDISEAGVAFITAAELTVGEDVELRFCQSADKTLSCQVRLTYRMRRRYGGYFVGPAPSVYIDEAGSPNALEIGWPI